MIAANTIGGETIQALLSTPEYKSILINSVANIQVMIWRKNEMIEAHQDHTDSSYIANQRERVAKLQRIKTDLTHLITNSHA